MSRSSKKKRKNLKTDRGTTGGGGPEGPVIPPPDPAEEINTVVEAEEVENPIPEDAESPEDAEARLEQMIQSYEEDLQQRFDSLQAKYGDELDEAQYALCGQAGAIIVAFGKKANEILASTEEDLSTTAAKASKVEEAHGQAQKEMKSIDKVSMRERWGNFVEKAKGVKSALTKPSQLRDVIVKASYDTVGSVFGIKFVGDLFLALGKRGDIYNYFSEKGQVKKDKAEILEAFMEEMGKDAVEAEDGETEEPKVETSEEVVAEVEKYKQKIDASSLSKEDKEELKENLAKVLESHDEEAENLNEQKQDQAKKLLGTYLKTKIKGTKIAKDALNTAMVATGLFAARGLMYGVMAAAERGQKASDTFAKQRLTREIQGPETKTDEIEVQGPAPKGEGPPTTTVETPIEVKEKSKLGFILRDMTVNATRENAKALMFKGSKGDGEHKKADFAKAAGNLLRLAGIGSATINAFTDSGILDTASVDKIIDAIQENGASSLGDTAQIVGGEFKDNFIQNAANVFNIGGSKDKVETEKEAVDKAVEAGIAGTVAPVSDPFDLGGAPQMEATPPASTMDDIEALYDKPLSGIDAMPGTPSETIGEFADAPASDVVGETPDTATGPLEDIIQTEEGKSADSIWRSTKNIIMNNPERFGYDGDAADTAAMSQWAETQTANLIDTFNTDQGGNLADLVHDGDKVIINFEGGEPALSFEASSGIEASHLSDTNVDKFFKGVEIPDDVEHTTNISADTGDQYHSFKIGDDTYKVYDWDRDGDPNVVFPDGHTEEMSVEDLLARGKELAGVEEVTPEIVPDVASSEQITEQFLSGESQYNEDLYESSKESGKLDEVFHKLLSTEDKTKITPFIEDHFKASNLSENELNIFLRYIYANQELANFDGSPVDLVEDFETHAVSSFGDLKGGNADIWRAVKVGDQYALVQKFHTGMWPMRGDHYFVDIDGNGVADMKLDHDAMEAAYNKGSFSEVEPVSSPVATEPEPLAPEAPKAPEQSPEPVATTPEASSPEPLEVKTPEGHTANFQYNEKGEVNGIKTDGNLSGNPKSLNDDFRKTVIESWEKAGSKGSLQIKIDQVQLQARQIDLDRSILASMEGSGQGDTPEANFLRENIDRGITRTEQRYGNIFNDGTSTPSPEPIPAEPIMPNTGTPKIEGDNLMPEPDLGAPPAPEAPKTPEPVKPGVFDFTEDSSTEPLEVKTPEGHTANFQYNEKGEVIGINSNGHLKGGIKSLNDDFRKTITEAWENSGRKGDVQFNVDKVELSAQQIDLDRSILASMENSGQGDTPEANFLRENINREITRTEQRYGDVFNDGTLTPSPEPIPDTAVPEIIEEMDSTDLIIKSLNDGKPELNFSMEKLTTANLDYLNEIKDETKVILLSLKGLGEDMDEVKKQKLIGACQTVLSAVEKQIDIKTS
jgi:hypothetical protein